MEKVVGDREALDIMMRHNYPLNPKVTRLMKYRFLRAFQPFYFNDYKTKMRVLLDRLKPDIVHINNGGYPGAMGCNAAAIAAKEFGAKVIYMANGITPRSKLRKTAEKLLDSKVLRSIDCFLAGSKYTSEKLMNSVFLATYPLEFMEKFKVIPNTLHDHKLLKRDWIRRKFGISDSEILIGSVGRFEERKGFEYLINAYKSLAKTTDKRCCLLLVGSGPLESELIQLVSGTRIKFAIGKEEDAYSYINAMDIYCQPSIEQEDLPNTIMMAMKLGKPIVATNVAGIPEMVQDNYNGYIVEPKDVYGLRTHLSFLVENPIGRKDVFIEENKRLYQSRYSNDVVLTKYLNLYMNLLGRESLDEIAIRRHL
jgi:glycosyltransferase involved in cell wall biosynthesis